MIKIGLVLLIFLLLYLIMGGFLLAALILDSLIKGHDLPTSRKCLDHLAQVIAKYKPKGGHFYDLGCGRGRVVLSLKKKLPQLEVYGVDKNGLRIFFTKLKSFLLGRKINLIKQDIFKKDLSKADIIYTYLWYDLMPPLEKKLKKELSAGSLVVTNTSKFPSWQPVEKIVTHPKMKDKDQATANFETLFVYLKK